MFATRSRAWLFRSSVRQWSGGNSWRQVSGFATSSRQCEQVGPREDGSKRDSHGDKKQKPGGSYTRVLGIFAAGIPIGWTVHVLQDSKEHAPTTARPTEFVKYALIDKEDVSSTCSIFTLKPATSSSISTKQLYDDRAITSVQFKQPQLQIARSYTTLPPVEGQEGDELRFLIRREQRGEVSGYIHRLPLGSEVDIRGPGVEYLLPSDVKEVMFLAGGTGIAPALQITDKLAATAEVHVLWASRRREDCKGGVNDTTSARTSPSWNFFGWWSPFGLPSSDAGRATSDGDDSQPNAIVSQIKSLKEQQRGREAENRGFTVDYYVDDEGTSVQPSRMTELLSRSTGLEQGKRLLFVSGPEGFINYWAGPKQWLGGQEVQGPLGGILSKLDLQGWRVVKL